eukprot:m.746217 g.746217  ORF g.746217 m.746217 type:complete len:451 (+) comp23133_c1_seq9:329-1681(+)
MKMVSSFTRTVRSCVLKYTSARYRRRVLIFFIGFLLFWMSPPMRPVRIGLFRFKERQARVLEQSAFLRLAVLTLSAHSRESYRIAETYYTEQRPLFMKAAQEFYLHQYWADAGQHITSIDMGWYELLGIRIKGMADMYRASGRDDFKVEKDKCEMYRFIQLNKLPHCPMIGYWSTKEAFVQAISDGTAMANATRFPVFLKTCHLTQGSSKSTRPLPSAAWAAENADNLANWLAEKWEYRADDWERPWRVDGNVLTDHLTPGILLQSPARLSFNPETHKMQIVEIKVEVFWGRAYAGVSSDIPGIFGGGARFIRGVVAEGDSPNGAIEGFSSKWDHFVAATDRLPRTGPGSWFNWVIDENHLNLCVWPLAEKTARIMGIDAVRIDIFLEQGNPTACSINENSLSDGMGYGHHMEFMSRLWAEPHVRKLYRTYNNRKHIYEQTEADVGILNM